MTAVGATVVADAVEHEGILTVGPNIDRGAVVANSLLLLLVLCPSLMVYFMASVGDVQWQKMRMCNGMMWVQRTTCQRLLFYLVY